MKHFHEVGALETLVIQKRIFLFVTLLIKVNVRVTNALTEQCLLGNIPLGYLLNDQALLISCDGI